MVYLLPKYKRRRVDEILESFEERRDSVIDYRLYELGREEQIKGPVGSLRFCSSN